MWSGLVSGDTGPSQVLTIFLKICSYLRLHILKKTIADPTIWISSHPRRTYELQGRSLAQLSRAFNSFSSEGTDQSLDPQSETIVSVDTKLFPFDDRKKDNHANFPQKIEEMGDL